MKFLFLKELNSFLNALIGYVVLVVFFILVGVFLWIFPDTQFNIPESGYAGVDGLFMLAPWVFLFLIPSITMKAFSEEKKSGTMELLLTLPVSDMTIILSKFFAGCALVVIALIPTLIYFLSVNLLSFPAWNADQGAFWGSFAGLLFLASSFVAIGIFSSALTDSQIISFVLAVFLCFLFYTGFDSLSGLAFFGKFDLVLQQTGIAAHYASMSRGVLDSRDLVYFLSLTFFFLFTTKVILSHNRK